MWTGGVVDRSAWAVRGVQETVADQAGVFHFAGLPDGQYRVRAARPNAPEAALALSAGTTATPGPTPVKVVVADAARATGKVALADGNVPVAFTLTLGATNPVAFASKDGAFALTATGGTFPLTVSGPGFVTLTIVFSGMSIANWIGYTWLPLYLYEKFNVSLAEAGFTGLERRTVAKYRKLLNVPAARFRKKF